MNSKLPNVGTTIFTVMSSLAMEHKAINLGQGFPDFGMSEELITLVNEAMQNGFNQYAHMNGYRPLLEAIAEKAEDLYGAKVHPDTEITITPGGTYALYTAMTTVLHPGDEVIVTSSSFVASASPILRVGATARFVDIELDYYMMDLAQLEQAVSSRT